jgi:outer membrane protein OmpA-like peptidoglycan-associated protein
MFTKLIATSLAVGFVVSTAAAQESQTSTMTTPTRSHMNVHDPVGWFPFIGISGGYVAPDVTLETEASHGDLKIIGSNFSESRRSVFDIGLGFMGDSFNQGITKDNFLSSGIAELAWRYNSTSRWQIGPVVDAFIGGGSRYGSSDPTWTTFAGLQLMKEFAIGNKSMMRVGLKGMTDVSIPSADIRTVMLDLQWGFGAEQTAPAVAVRDTTPTPPTTQTETGTTGSSTREASTGLLQKDAHGNWVLSGADNDKMQFETNRAELRDQEYVRKIGSSLSSSPLFDRVEAVGYADQRGTDAINIPLSRRRAANTAAVLRQGGLKTGHVQSIGRGAIKSSSSYQALMPEDLQRNRRVDLIFHGVKDESALESALGNVIQ